MDLSIVVPAFRQNRWEKFYESIANSFHGSWELILIGPYKPLFEKPNLKWIEDWGAPARCQQRGLLEAQGDYVTFSWDDAIYCENMLDKAWDILKEHNFNPKIAVLSKFVEGETEYDWALADSFSLIYHHNDSRMKTIPYEYYVQNTGMTSRKELLEIGGVDCQFRTMALAVLDLSVRLQANGVKFIIQQGVVLRCTWELGGEHKPIEDTFMTYDKPLYQNKYHEGIPIKVELDNWKNSPEKWTKRFKQ